jgi:hypothetical protein
LPDAVRQEQMPMEVELEVRRKALRYADGEETGSVCR